jgi:hypothetical protein
MKMADKEIIRRKAPRTDFTKVYVEYIQSTNRANKVGFVAKIYKDIADALVARGQARIITDAAEKARAEVVIGSTAEAAVNKPKASVDGVMPRVGTHEEL